jgi:hypothetical protein
MHIGAHNNDPVRKMPFMSHPSITDAIIVAVAQLVDDAQAGQRRDPSHSDLTSLIPLTELGSTRTRLYPQ